MRAGRINDDDDLPIQNGLGHRIGMRLGPRGIIQYIRRAAVLLQILVGDASGEDGFAIFGVGVEGGEGSHGSKADTGGGGRTGRCAAAAAAAAGAGQE